MLNSTPTKAIISKDISHSEIHCLICGLSINSRERLSIFGRSEWDFKGAISRLIEGDLQLTERHYICNKKCLTRLKKYIKMSSGLENLHRELREEILCKNEAVSFRIKRGHNEFSPIKKHEATSTEDHRSKPAKKSLFTPDIQNENTKAESGLAVLTPVSVRPICQQNVTQNSEDCLVFPEPVQIDAHTDALLSSAVIIKRIPTTAAAKDIRSIPGYAEAQRKPYIQVTLNYPSCEKTYKTVLSEDLEPLGKALARRGSYKQIAASVFRSTKLKDCIIQKTLDSLAKECIDLCSKKKPSLLRSNGPVEMSNFSLSKLCKEWKERAPLFYSFLMTCSTGKDKKIDWFPSVAVAGSALLKERNMHMNATQSLISVMVRQSGIQKLLHRLNVMKLRLSTPSSLKKLDTYGLNFKEELESLKSPKSETRVNCEEPVPTTTMNNEPKDKTQSYEGSYKVVLDNIDLRILTRDMTADNHWCNHSAVKDRVSSNNSMKQTELLDLDNSKILPGVTDHQNLRSDYIQLVSRILVEHLPCFNFLKSVCPLHIPHMYSKEMAQKSEKIPLGVIFKSKNKSEEMVEILNQIQGYTAMYNEDRVGTSVPVVGDQLTVERGVNVSEALQNSFTEEERLEGVHMEIADWHTAVNFLKVIYNRHYSTTSDADTGTLFADRNVINRRNVVADVSSAWAPCKAFMLLEIKARVIAMAMNTLEMTTMDNEPKTCIISEGLRDAPDLIKRLYLQKLSIKIIDTFVVDEHLITDLMDNILSTQEQENVLNGQALTAEGRFPCRSMGCDKSFKYDVKSRRDHEMTHNPPPESDKPVLQPEYPTKKHLSMLKMLMMMHTITTVLF